jgi:hypothetical protein
MLYPAFEALSDPARIDQSIGGFLDYILKQNFAAFVEQAGAEWSMSRYRAACHSLRRPPAVFRPIRRPPVYSLHDLLECC